MVNDMETSIDYKEIIKKENERIISFIDEYLSTKYNTKFVAYDGIFNIGKRSMIFYYYQVDDVTNRFTVTYSSDDDIDDTYDKYKRFREIKDSILKKCDSCDVVVSELDYADQDNKMLVKLVVCREDVTSVENVIESLESYSESHKMYIACRFFAFGREEFDKCKENISKYPDMSIDIIREYAPIHEGVFYVKNGELSLPLEAVIRDIKGE